MASRPTCAMVLSDGRCQEPVKQRTVPGGRPGRYCEAHLKGRTGRPAGWPTGRPRAASTKAKIAAAGTGRTMSAETRAKLSAANSGPRAPHSQAHNEHIGQALSKTLAADPAERQRRGERLEKDRKRTLSKRWGPRWQTVLTKKATAAKRGKPASAATRAHLVIARAAKGTNSPELQALLVEHRWRPLQDRTSRDLLILEDRAQAADAIRFIRKIIKTQGHRRPTYTLAAIRGYMAAGHPSDRIARKIRVSVRWARELMQLVREIDGTPAGK
jgi:NUMOD3 motif